MRVVVVGGGGKSAGHNNASISTYRVYPRREEYGARDAIRADIGGAVAAERPRPVVKQRNRRGVDGALNRPVRVS